MSEPHYHINLFWSDEDSCWIHAHLHRIDGDLPNAAYWYSRAGRGVPKTDLQSEWEAIVTALLGEGSHAPT